MVKIVPLVLLACLLFSSALAAPTIRDLGTPIRAMSIREHLLVKDPATGRPTYYSGMFTNAGHAKLIRFDYAVGDVEFYELTGTKGVYGLTEGLDGKVYAGTIIPARFFRFDPFTKTVENLGSADGEEYVFELVTGPDGRIYAATYPNAKVVVYDPQTGRIDSLGSMSQTEKYCTSVAVADNGLVFCGIGSHADLVVYDPRDGNRRSILPDRYRHYSFCNVQGEGNIVYASLASEVLLIYNASSLELIREILANASTRGIGVHRDYFGGPLLIHGLPGGYRRFNLSTGRLDPFYTPKYSPYDPETGIAYARRDGRQVFEAWNLTSDELICRVNVGIHGEGMNVFSLGTGPDGCIYGGSDSLLKLFRYCPSEGRLEDLGFPIVGQGGEIYSFHSFNGKLYFASYSDAYLGVYDPTKPWNPGTSMDSNPRTIGPVGDEQNRPPALTHAADGRIYVGSIPTYGKMGGALSIYDPATDTIEVHRHIIPNQSVVSLTTSLDGWTVYGGSSTRGGSGTEPIAKEAHFFAWDVRQGKVVLDIVPVRGASSIRSLVTAQDGKIYGCAGSTLFVFDPEEGRIVHKQSSRVGEIYQMVAYRDGLIYGATDGSIFRFKPIESPGEEIGFETLSDQGDRTVALDEYGNVYFGLKTDLYVIENLPSLEAPRSDMEIYTDGLDPNWTLVPTRAEVDLWCTEPAQGRFSQRISFDRVCTVKYVPDDPWSITLWKYDALCFSINVENASISDIVITKTGSGGTASKSLFKDLGLELNQSGWNHVRIPVSELGWFFGSRPDSIDLTIIGSGTIYLDSMRLAVPEGFVAPFLVGILGVLCAGYARTRHAYA